MKVLLRRELEPAGILNFKRSVLFHLFVRVELNSEERDLVDMCDATKTIIHTWKSDFQDDTIDVTVRQLLHGYRIPCHTFIHLIRTEEEVRKTCGAFKQLLEKAKTFGEEELIEL